MEAEELRDLLDKYGLKVVSANVAIDAMENDRRRSRYQEDGRQRHVIVPGCLSLTGRPTRRAGLLGQRLERLGRR